jgi:hypothetical protein
MDGAREPHNGHWEGKGEVQPGWRGSGAAGHEWHPLAFALGGPEVAPAT